MSQNSSQPIKLIEKLDNLSKNIFSLVIEGIIERKYLSGFVILSIALLTAFCTGEIEWFVSLVGILLAAWFAWRHWRLQHFTKEWGELIRFLHDNPEFMDKTKTEKYKENFKDDELIKYDFVARLCIAFIDDMYFLNYKNELDGWFKGSIKLLVQSHYQWFKDNHDSYDKKFIEFIQEKLSGTQITKGEEDESTIA